MDLETVLSLRLFYPEIVLLIGIVALFLYDATSPRLRETYFPLIVTAVSCLLAGWASVHLGKTNSAGPLLFFSKMAAADGFSRFFRLVFFTACASCLYLSFGSREIEKSHRMEFSLLFLCVTFGMSLMALASHLLMLYIGIETVSILSFVLAGFQRQSLRSNEASFKYLVFGALASGLLLYGISLVYGLTGSLQYQEIAQYLSVHAERPTIIVVAFVMICAGLAFKIAAFPMHYWVPDVYEGSPTPVTAFFSVGPKAAGFAALVRLLLVVFTVKGLPGYWKAVSGFPVVSGCAVISAATMLVGNLSAIGQKNVKRMLAYSSIAHVGYMLMGLVALSADGLTAVLFYLVVYTVMNMGAFWVVSIVGDLKGSEDLEAFRGLGWSMPVLGVCMGIFLFSLTGIPVFAGFIGKFLLFGALLRTPGYLWLAVLGMANSVISLYYYTRIIRVMWLERPEIKSRETRLPEAAPALALYHAIGLIALAIPTILLGLFFTPVLGFARQALSVFLS